MHKIRIYSFVLILKLLVSINSAWAVEAESCLSTGALQIVKAEESWLEQGMTRATFLFPEGEIDLKKYIATKQDLQEIDFYLQDYKDGWKDLLDKSATTFPELESVETFTIIHYTSGGGYRKYNLPFKNGFQETLLSSQTKEFVLVKVLASALNKIKTKFVGLVVRNADLNEVDIAWMRDRMQKKLPIYSKSFWSTTRGSKLKFNARNVKFEIQSRTGVYIRDISIFSEEDEVLFNPGVPFQIDAIEEAEGKIVIKLTELPF